MVAGLTFTVAPLLIPLALKFVTPSVYTTLKVPVAGRVNVSAVFVPAQMVAVPLMSAVGKVPTFTTALPVRLALGAVTEQVVAGLVALTKV